MKDDEEVCNTTLDLGIGLSQFVPKRDIRDRKNKQMFLLDLSIPLQSSDHANDCKIEDDNKASKGSSVSNASKEDEDRNYEQNYSRKKLRLSKEQVILLEDTFKQHTTLNTVQKQTLAGKLNLKPRQVEVWFQNRRARTKLKQTEMDCEFLKKNCERLSEENRRLHRELAELQSAVRMEQPPPTPPIPPPFFIQIPKAAAATLAMCPSCDKSRRGDGGRSGREVVHKPKPKQK